MPGVNRYSYFGATLHSPIAFDELPPAPENWKDAAQVELVIGDVPHTLSKVAWETEWAAIDADGRALISIEHVGRFLVTDGRTIRCAPASGADPKAISYVVLGIVSGALLLQLNTLPLHASCVSLAGKVVAVVGLPGQGKSTLTAALIKHGASLIAEDITVIKFIGEIPHAVQGAFSMRLWPDSVAALYDAQSPWLPIREGHPKYCRILRLPDRAREPIVLNAILRLEIENDGRPAGLRRLRGPTAILPLEELVHRPGMARALGRYESLLDDLMRLALRTPIFELRRPREFQGIGRAVGMVEEALRLSEV